MSDLENTFETQVKQHSLPDPIREFPFALQCGRKFRFDFAWLDAKIAVEIQGATYRKGAHSTGTGLARDFEKNNLAVSLGWRVLYFDSKMIHDGRAVNFVEDLFKTTQTMEMEF